MCLGRNTSRDASARSGRRSSSTTRRSGVGGDDEVTFGVGLVVDGLVELRDDHHADAVCCAVLQQSSGGGFEINLGLVAGTKGGEAGRLAVGMPPGPRAVICHGVGAAVPELSGRLPHRSIRGEHAGDRLAGVAGASRLRDRPGGGGDKYGARGTDVGCARSRCSPHRGGLRCRGLRRRLRDGRGGQRLAVAAQSGVVERTTPPSTAMTAHTAARQAPRTRRVDVNCSPKWFARAGTAQS